MEIGFGLGLAALVLTVLAVGQGVRRRATVLFLAGDARDQVLIALSDTIIAIADGLDHRFGEWLYQTGRWTAERRWLKYGYNPLWRLATRIAWSVNSRWADDSGYPREGATLITVSAASPVYPDYMYDDDFDDEDENIDEWDAYRNEREYDAGYLLDI